MLKNTSLALILLFFVASCSSSTYKVTRVSKSADRAVAQAASMKFKSKSDQNLQTVAAILDNDQVKKEILQTKDTFTGIVYFGTNNQGVATYSLYFENKKPNKELQNCFIAIFVKGENLQIEDYYECPE